ncbi:Csu type fimbrial protein [Sphingomonas koreensis]|uniref:Csu type fimbrial protein n=1 Tax=Sphingomonas koreensis TaxID=93064 RepID=UPI000AD73E4E|nr:spore coat U domain-containing protein [Sphingomonas koreensis]PJI89301.1 spore coat protein U-like protein [Sphingomonas koreensis]
MKKMTVIGAVALMASATPSFAQDTGSLDVTAEVLSSCNITSTSTLAFGTVDQAVANIDNQGSVSLVCTATTPWVLHTDDGINAAGAQKRMKHASQADTLNYDIFADAGRSVPFPTVAGTPGAGPASDTGNGQLQIVTVFGRIPSGQTLPRPGNYSDTLTVTVSY